MVNAIQLMLHVIVQALHKAILDVTHQSLPEWAIVRILVSMDSLRWRCVWPHTEPAIVSISLMDECGIDLIFIKSICTPPDNLIFSLAAGHTA
jgi:hypothetical protein